MSDNHKKQQSLLKNLSDFIMTESLSVPYYKYLSATVTDDCNLPVMRFFKDLGGEKSSQKKVIINKVLCDWATKLKCADGSYYQPSTTNRMLRQLFAALKQKYSFAFDLKRDFNFPGGLHVVMAELYEQRLLSIQDYGQGQKRAVIDPNEACLFENFHHKFDATDLQQHQMRLLLKFGTISAFRGNKEHTFLLCSYIKFSYFTSGEL